MPTPPSPVRKRPAPSFAIDSPMTEDEPWDVPGDVEAMLLSAQPQLADLVARARPASVRLALDVLKQDVHARDVEEAWAEQVGPCLSEEDTARLLSKETDEIVGASNLLRIPTSDGRRRYPILQFEGRGLKPGVPDVVRILSTVLDPASIAAWLTGTNRRLSARRPIDVLSAGEIDTVRLLARSVARELA